MTFSTPMRSSNEGGHAGVGVRVTPVCTEIITRAPRTHDVLGENGRQIRKLTSVVQRRFGFPGSSVEHFARRVENRAYCAAQAESVRYKLHCGTAVHRVWYGDV